MPGRLVNEATCCFGVAIGKGDVGLDVEDGRVVAQIGSQNVDDRTVFGVLNVVELYAGESQRVRAEGAARCKDTHALYAAQAWRSHRGRPLGIAMFSLVGRLCGYFCLIV